MIFDSRATWGARPPKQALSGWAPGEPQGIAIHYVGGSGTLNLPDHAHCLTLMYNLQGSAMAGTANQWTYSDLEYNLAACPHGHVIEGRGLHVQAASQLNANYNDVGLLALANVDDPLTDGLKQGILDAIVLIRQSYPGDTWVGGHRDTAGNPTGTNCPGDTIESWIQAGLPGSPTPAPPPPPIPAEVVPMHALIYGTPPTHHTFRVDQNGAVLHGWFVPGGWQHDLLPGMTGIDPRSLAVIVDPKDLSLHVYGEKADRTGARHAWWNGSAWDQDAS